MSFARELLTEHGDAARAAIQARATWFWLVSMTALAMIICTAPTLLGLGAGGEQTPRWAGP